VSGTVSVTKPTRDRRPGINARRALAALGLAVVLGAMPAAAEPGDADRSASKLRFEAMPYAWVPGFHGTIDVEDTTLRVDVGPVDLLELVFDGDAFAAGGYFALSYGRLGVFADSFGGYGEMDVAQTIPTQLCCTLTIDAKSKMKFALTDVGLGYDLLRLTLPERERPLRLAAWAGARVMYLSNEVDADFDVVHGAQRIANVDESLAWADPLIGVRWSVPVLDAFDLDFRGDIGGFGASSDLTWGLVGDVRLWLPWKPFGRSAYALMGYRVVALDRSPNDAEVNLQMRGPLLGAGVVF
jgi:hypothetical protein